MKIGHTIIMITGLLLVLTQLWCGQREETDREVPDPSSATGDEPGHVSEDSGPAVEPTESGSQPRPDGSLEASSSQEADAEVPGEETADTGVVQERDAAPVKRDATDVTKASKADAGGSKAPVAQLVDASVPPIISPPFKSVTPETDSLTALLQKVYQDVDSFEADFEQTYRNRLLDRTRESTGHVWLQPPSKMRWEYAPPSKNLIVADGRTLFVFEPEPNQVVTMPVSGSELPSVMAFLTGGRNLTEDYHVQEVHRDKLSPRGQAGLELRPKTPSSVVSRVVLVIARQTGKVQRTVLVEPEGNTNTFVWSKVKTSLTIPARQFTFTPPAGARVVER